MRWSPRIAQTFYKEWALEKLGKLIGKVRYAAGSFPPYIGEYYVNGRTYTAYKGDSEQAARQAVIAAVA
jgi:hypothetical protein